MKSLKVDNKNIGPGFPVFFIAEAGVNHNGSLKIALKPINGPFIIFTLSPNL